MRQDCRNYESRTYATGETVRMCRVDMAPEAPWRCPTDCPKFSRKLVDGGWVVGGLNTAATPEQPKGFDENSIRLLDEAENIINAAGPGIIDEVKAQREDERRKRIAKADRRRRWWWPF